MIIFKENQPIEITTEEAFHAFAQDYKIIHAAGGVVYNENDEVLLIYRLNKWDLPKGKVEEGEQYEEAALREVKEETGLQNMHLTKSLPSTFHTYTLHGENILKETHWFSMFATKQTLTPQTIEAITEATWVHRTDVDSMLNNSYPSLALLWNEINTK